MVAKDDTNKGAAQAENTGGIQADPREEAIYQCIKDAFKASGLKPITSRKDEIVWPRIPDDVKDDIARFLEDCITNKVSDPGPLIGVIRALAAHSPVMTVAELIKALLALLDSMR